MSEIVPFLPEALARWLVVLMGLGIMGSSLWRIYKIDLKVNKYSYAFLHGFTVLGGFGCVTDDPWGPFLVLLSVSIQHFVTDKLWRLNTPDTALKGSK